ncbi:MAG: TatD family hydrolase [Hyphomicrobiales bacterium]|nr:TatD family hydrolase [Hyphomicrobiales bacterium]
MIDSHCHLDFPELHADLAGVLARAGQAGVEHLVTISTGVRHFERYRDLAEAHANVSFTIGTHPNYVGDEPEATAQTLVDLARHPKCVGIGEAGLDYHYDKAPRDQAARVFRNHIAAARISGLPLVIHSRDADDDMAAILREEMGQGPFAAILHCFTASPALARTGVELGLFISFSGVLTFKTAAQLRDIAAMVPEERLLVETDAPFLAPVPHRGKTNEPAYVVETAKVLANARNVPFEHMARVTRANTLRCFSKLQLAEQAA